MKDYTIPVRRYVIDETMLNPNHTLFGGCAMGWMDKLGHNLAESITGKTMFTSSADKIKFLKPAFQGEVVEVKAEVENLGAIRLVVKTTVTADPDGPNRRDVLTGYFTFVQLDENYRPRPIHYPSDENLLC